MTSSYFTDPIIFLIDSLCSLYILAVLLRFLLQYFGADFYNPIAQFLLKVTHPPLKVLRRFVPAIGKLDTSSLLLAIVLQMLADFLVFLLKGVSISLIALIFLSLTQLINLVLNIFIFSVFARALLSWFNQVNYDATTSVLISLTEPLLRLCRKIVPEMGGLDFSPLIVLLVLQLAKMVLLPPLHGLAGLLG